MLTAQDTALLWTSLKAQLQEIAAMRGAAMRNRPIRLKEHMPALVRLMYEGDIAFVTSEEFRNDYLTVTAQLRQYINTDIEYIKRLAERFFRDEFSRRRLVVVTTEASNKNNGNQIGAKLKVSYTAPPLPELQEVSFYIKNHLQGARLSHGGSSMQGKIVNLRELLIYKILEYTGVGSKAYFYVDRLAPEGVYIATQDAAFTKNPQKHKEFKVYEDIQQQIRAQQSDYGYLTLETTLSLWEILVLVEVLRLTDALTNNGNFGRMTRTIAEQENSYYEKWKLIDFDIRRGQYLQPTIYNDLINGVNREDYGGKPEFQQLFFTTSIEERMSSLGYALYKLGQDRDSLSGGSRKLSFENAVNAATSNIQQFIDENRVWLNLEPSEIQILSVYPREIKQNFACLLDGNSTYKGPRAFGI